MPKAKEDLPYGQSIMPVIMEQDSTPLAVQYTLLWGTASVVCGVLPFLGHLAAAGFGLDIGWDTRHAVSATPSGIARLAAAALGVSGSDVLLAGAVPAGALATLWMADLCDLRWPARWRAHGIQCYEEMFCEPTRQPLPATGRGPRLVAHPGNTYSNFLYLFTGIMVLLAAPGTAFWMPDAMFGAMLVLLSVFSVVWHACSGAKTHYPDLWAMESCIVYLILRACCIALLWYRGAAGWVAPVVTATVYGGLIYAIGLFRLGPGLAHLSGPGPFDNGLLVSGRRRLLNRGRPDNRDLGTGGVCLFLGMPALYFILPTLANVLVTGTVGSLTAATIAGCSLGLGWSLRMFERFVLDGWVPMNAILSAAPSLWRTVGAAVVSPTAIFHWCTGVTLLSGYAWVRSIEHVARVGSAA